MLVNVCVRTVLGWTELRCCVCVCLLLSCEKVKNVAAGLWFSCLNFNGNNKWSSTRWENSQAFELWSNFETQRMTQEMLFHQVKNTLRCRDRTCRERERQVRHATQVPRRESNHWCCGYAVCAATIRPSDHQSAPVAQNLTCCNLRTDSSCFCHFSNFTKNKKTGISIRILRSCSVITADQR